MPDTIHIISGNGNVPKLSTRCRSFAIHVNVNIRKLTQPVQPGLDSDDIHHPGGSPHLG